MDFFKTSEGWLHGGRIGGVFYAVALLPQCYVAGLDKLCVLRIISTAGWWLALCDKESPQTFSKFAASPRRLVGAIIMLIALAVHFYVVVRR